MLLISMAAEGIYPEYLGLYRYLLSEEFYIVSAVEQLASYRTRTLIPYKQYRAFRSPEIVLEVMAYPARLAHARCRDDDLRSRIFIYGL